MIGRSYNRAYASLEADRLHRWLDYHAIEHVSHLRAGILVLQTKRPITPKSNYLFFRYEEEQDPIGRVIWLPKRHPAIVKRENSTDLWQAPKIVIAPNGQAYYALKTFQNLDDAIRFFEEQDPRDWIGKKDILPLSFDMSAILAHKGVLPSMRKDIIIKMQDQERSRQEEPMINDDFIVTINGVQYMHIAEVAERTRRSISSLRYLCMKEARGREKLACYRDGPRIYIPVDAITSYEFFDGQRAYHYVPSTTEPGYYDKEYVKEIVEE